MILATPRRSAMSPRGFYWVYACMVAALAVSGIASVRAEDMGTSDSVLDALEMKLELGRHERLLAVRMGKGATLAPFASDGCSGGLSSVWRMASSTFPALAKRHGEHPPWESCCTVHDRLYHAGAPAGADARTSFEARRRADEELSQCVRRIGEARSEALSAEYGLKREEVTLIYAGVADLIYRAVRLGGAPCTGLSWRWGFGWPDCE